MTEAKKNDKGKARYDLVPVRPMAEIVNVYSKGAEKYDDRNWEKGLEFGRVYAAIHRHLAAWWGGENCDVEDGLSHLAHAAWGCMALLEYQIRGREELDDRPC